mmetsp:Transcript_13382/g.39428  ORF Transcript_13382/g.39428 Transcript_13382/m.39428 type:complete len:353 (+) Transcript_13382:106-1164(+)
MPALLGVAYLCMGLGVDGSGTGRVVRPTRISAWMKQRSIIDQMAIPNRDVKVWLPPAYDEHPPRHFPTLYVHDGQNAIFDDESWTGHSWRLGGTLSYLISSGRIPTAMQPIVVLVSNTGRRRHLEYSDSPIGDAFIDFCCDELKLRIDDEFRTLAGPEHTYALGASLGGLAAFRSVWRRPESFGHCACMSPVFQLPLLMDVAMNGRRLVERHAPRIYIDNGGDTEEVRVPLFDADDGPNPGYWFLDTQLQPGVDAMCQALQLQGVDFEYHRAPGARHNERGWAQRIFRPLEHLYGFRTDGAPKASTRDRGSAQGRARMPMPERSVGVQPAEVLGGLRAHGAAGSTNERKSGR